MTEVGARVYALQSSDSTEVQAFGWGTYEGMHPYPGGDSMFGTAGRGNPRIKLDSGGYVYGCECWWGPATQEQVDAKVAGRTLTLVPAPHQEVPE